MQYEYYYSAKTIKQKLDFLNKNISKIGAITYDSPSFSKLINEDNPKSIKFTEKELIFSLKGIERKFLWSKVSDFENKSVIDQIDLYYPEKEDEVLLTFFITNDVCADYAIYMKDLMTHNNNIIE